MANPSPQALHDAAASIRAQAETARQETLGEYRRAVEENKHSNDQEAVQLAVNRAEVKSREEVLQSRQQQAVEMSDRAADREQKARDAEQKGDAGKAQELSEDAARARANSDATMAQVTHAQTDLDQARVTLAEHERDTNAAFQQRGEQLQNLQHAETQLDAMENKARMLDQASRRLMDASITDDVPHRADLELEAEKLIKDANGIQIDAAVIAQVTGHDLQLPDTTALPADTTPAGDTPSDRDTTPVGDTSLEQPSDGDTARGAASDHLEDQFDAPATADGGARAGAADTDAVSGDASGAAAAAPTDDLLGVSPAGATDAVALDAGQPAGVADSSAVPDPVSDTESAAAFGTPSDAPSDPTFDSSGVASDSGALVSDPAADFSSVAAADDTSSSDESDV